MRKQGEQQKHKKHFQGLFGSCLLKLFFVLNNKENNENKKNKFDPHLFCYK